MFDLVMGIGLVAGSLTAFCTVPQLLQIWKRRCAKDISYNMYVVLSVGVALWITYGVFKNDLAIIVTNSISLTLNLAMIISKYWIGSTRRSS